jgi:hypothetical protein
MNFFDFGFWQAFVSNAAATLVDVAMGIPIALWISSYQEKTSEKKRKNKILRPVICSGLQSCSSFAATICHVSAEIFGCTFLLRRSSAFSCACLGRYPRRPRLRRNSQLIVDLSTPSWCAIFVRLHPMSKSAFIWYLCPWVSCM